MLSFSLRLATGFASVALGLVSVGLWVGEERVVGAVIGAAALGLLGLAFFGATRRRPIPKTRQQLPFMDEMTGYRDHVNRD